MTEQDEQILEAKSLDWEKRFKVPRNYGAFVAGVFLGIWVLCLTGLLMEDDAPDSIWTFVLIVGGLTLFGLYFIWVGILAVVKCELVLDEKGIYYNGNRNLSIRRKNVGIEWGKMVKVNIQNVRKPKYDFEELVIKGRSRRMSFTSFNLPSHTLMSIFKLVAEQKKKYPHIEIEDGCGWLEPLN